MIPCWLVVSTHLKNICQNGNLPPNRDENKKCFKPPPSLVNQPFTPTKTTSQTPPDLSSGLVQRPVLAPRIVVPARPAAPPQRWTTPGSSWNLWKFVLDGVWSLGGSFLGYVGKLLQLIFFWGGEVLLDSSFRLHMSRSGLAEGPTQVFLAYEGL